jgi:hypothetical protein
LHGTSQRIAFAEQINIYPKWSWKWVKNKLGLLPEKEWVHVVGSRNVTLSTFENREEAKKKGFYADESFPL